MRGLVEKLRNCESWYGCHSSAANICGNAQITAMCKDAADAIEKLQSMNNELEYALAGVMHSVDKWLEADDFDHDEVQRAAIMREKVLRIVERLQAKLKQTRRERDAAVEALRAYANATDNKTLAEDIYSWVGKGEPVQEWISVKDRLPDKNIPSQFYLCYWNGYIRVCKYWRTRKVFELRGKEVKVTHWMPLPQPPKGE